MIGTCTQESREDHCQTPVFFRTRQNAGHLRNSSNGNNTKNGIIFRSTLHPSELINGQNSSTVLGSAQLGRLATSLISRRMATLTEI